MAAVEVDALYRQLLSELQGIVAPRVPAKRCYIVAAPFFDGIPVEFVQLIPGAGVVQDPDSVTGEVVETFDVAVGGKVRLDMAPQDTVKLTDDTLGMIAFRNLVWGNGFVASGQPLGLIGRVLTGNLNHVPITLRSWELARTNPEDPSMAMLISRFRWAYEVNHGI